MHCVVPVHCIDGTRFRKLFHSGFAAVQDDKS